VCRATGALLSSETVAANAAGHHALLDWGPPSSMKSGSGRSRTAATSQARSSAPSSSTASASCAWRRGCWGALAAQRRQVGRARRRRGRPRGAQGGRRQPAGGDRRPRSPGDQAARRPPRGPRRRAHPDPEPLALAPARAVARAPDPGRGARPGQVARQAVPPASALGAGRAGACCRDELRRVRELTRSVNALERELGTLVARKAPRPARAARLRAAVRSADRCRVRPRLPLRLRCQARPARRGFADPGLVGQPAWPSPAPRPQPQAQLRDPPDRRHPGPRACAGARLPRSQQAEGKSRIEALRCLKRQLVRRVWHLLRRVGPVPSPIAVPPICGTRLMS
jgi:hypothetical protein